MSILKKHAIENIRRLFAADEILCNQMVNLHLGKLTPEDIQRIREEKEQEAEFILQNIPKSNDLCITDSYSVDETRKNIQPVLTSQHITNGQAEIRND